MSISINVPDDVYSRFAEFAERQGKSPEELVIEWMAQSPKLEETTLSPDELVEEYDPTVDPLFNLAGIFNSGIPDMSANHDKYLAEAYADNHANHEE